MMNEAESMMSSFSGMGAGTIVTLIVLVFGGVGLVTIIKRYIPK